MNYFAIGFVAVVGVVGLGVDYQQQSVHAGLGLGQMSAADYVGTFEARFLGAKADARAAERERARKTAWREGGIQYLPEAPEGWTRRKYSESSNAAIMYNDTAFFEDLARDGTAKSMAEGLQSKDAMTKARKMDAHSYVYEHGDEVVFVSIDARNKPDTKSLHGIIGSTMQVGGSFKGTTGMQGYDVIGGVGFVELEANKRKMSAAQKKSSKHGFRRAHFRRLVGTVGFGQEVGVTVHANASSKTTNEILAAIDWDGLNNMLSTPMALVGNDVTMPEGTDVEALAEEQTALRAKYATLRARVAEFRLRNLDAAAFMFSTLAPGKTDISGGKVPDLSNLIDAAFRKEMRNLMAGKPSDHDFERIVSMIEVRPKSERTQNKGEMSEELKRELSGVSEAQTPSAPMADPALPRSEQAEAASTGGGVMAAIGSFFGGMAPTAAPAPQKAAVVVRSGNGKAGFGAAVGKCASNGVGKLCTVRD
ncbi:hypothetical protein U5922_010605 [Aquicoccus sp. G2-2]|uniref:hypothetical protein n=1 Tax=Aquicoccus sp. G2-2 TaxID=3092120 RepID=UPI002ADF76D2|nr:hypothetical protein [Aquicoccus sp. G2-2]MEA1113894.1 hypothetical protein [Aquicoccus sp. G2-2]